MSSVAVKCKCDTYTGAIHKSQDECKCLSIISSYYTHVHIEDMDVSLECKNISVFSLASRTGLKDVEFLTQVEDILIFNFVRMQEPISSIKYNEKTPQTKTLKTKFAIFWGGFKLFMTLNYGCNCNVDQINTLY
jgi:hypothetical protein